MTKHDVFQAISDPTRREMLTLLADQEMSIAAITECFPLSRTAVNKHLHVLFEAGLVHKQRLGKETRYRLQAKPLVTLKDWLAFFEPYWDEKLSALKEFVEDDQDKT